MRKLTRERGIAIVEQGKKAFMAIFEPDNCPFKDDVERKLWLKGYMEAKEAWFKPFDKFNKFKKKNNHTRRPYGKAYNR